MGYSTEALVAAKRVTVGVSSPGNAAFSVRAIRGISGRVLSYDSKLGRSVQ